MKEYGFYGFSIYVKHFLGWRGSEVFEWHLNRVAGNGPPISPLLTMDANSLIL